MSTLVPTQNGQNRLFKCYFLFNPNAIDKSYQFDSTVTGALPAQYQNPATQGEGAGLVLNQQINFSLLFDRTFELWAGPFQTDTRNAVPSGPGPYKYGAQWDVWAVERLVGVYGQAAGKGPSGPPVASEVDVWFADTSNPQSNEVTTGAGSISTVGGALHFQGWMTSLSAEYTRFDTNMVPSRAAVSVSFLQVYSNTASNTAPPATPANSAGTTGNPPPGVNTGLRPNQWGGTAPVTPNTPFTPGSGMKV